MAKLRAGTLRHKILIQRKTTSKDSNGATVYNWTNLKITRASINPITGSEFFINENIKNDVDSKIVLRFTDIAPADRIIFNERIFDIKYSLNFGERKNHILILAKEDLSKKYICVSDAILTEDNIDILTESATALITED